MVFSLISGVGEALESLEDAAACFGDDLRRKLNNLLFFFLFLVFESVLLWLLETLPALALLVALPNPL